VSENAPDNAVAIVGMAGRFPDANNVDEFWSNLRGGVESIRPLSDEDLLAAGVDPATLRDTDYVKAAGVLADVPMFDAGFFGVSPKDAAIMDPQHRHFLECAVTALENAGHAPRSFPGAIGVFAGCGMNSYFVHNVLTNPGLLRTVGFFLLRHTGNDRDFLPTTVSYKLDLRGPSMAIQTACSTSLVAIHAACQSLLAGECDMALAGGVTILVPHGQGYFFRENEPVAPDGHCRPFDADAQGTVVSSGAGVVVLRPLADALEDGDTVHAVIRGSAVNNDGAGKVGYLAPSVGGHAKVVAEALSLAGVSADSIDYVEAHGTGTRVGDPIEVTALTQAFRETTDRVGYCRIGSVKSNIGHLDTAAGVASVIKVARALTAREMPATLHFKAPNPEIDFAASPFVVNAELHPWAAEDGPRRAGVSSLGIGGTNAHVVLEEAPALPATEPAARPWQVLAISARTAGALDAAGENLATWLRAHPEADLADVAFTLQEGREAWDHRRVVAARSAEEAASALESRDALRVFSGRREGGTPGVAFLFSGAGAQHPDMARQLYEHEPVFRREMDRCLDLLHGLMGFDLRRWVYPEASEVEEARRQLELPSRLCPAVFATEWSLAALWRSWGIEPVAMIGHSLGEYAAACLAGVFSLEDALRMVVLRGILIDRLSGGAMLSLPMSEAEARSAIGDALDLAAVNAPSLCVVSGALERVQQLREELAAREIETRLVPVNAAGHSRHLDPILEEFRRGLATIRLAPPQMPYVSNVTGTWIRPEEAQDPDYWVQHLRKTVRFADGLGEILRDPDRVLLEVGPGQTLCALARQQPVKARGIVASLRKAADPISDVQAAVAAFGRLWLSGVPVPWAALRGPARRRRIALPTYPFEHKPYWIEPGRPATAEAARERPLERLTPLDAWFRRPAWQKAPIVAASAGEPDKWLIFVDKAGLGSEVADRLRKSDHDVVTVREGDTFYRFGDHDYALAPEAGRIGYDELVHALADRDLLPNRIVHFWTVTPDESFRPGSSFLHRNQECGFYSLLFLMQALGEGAESLPRQVAVISNGMQAVTDGEWLLHPEKATLLGPVRVIPHEFPGVACRSVDVDLPAPEPLRLRRRRPGPVPLDALADRIMAELTHREGASVVAWRGADRFEESLESAPSHTAGGGTPRIREEGVYLVTGGLGGVGFALAEQLALRYRARVVLVGRGGLPPEDQWETWLTGHGERDRTSRRIRAIRALRAAGGDAWAVSADVADVERMREIINETKERFGALHGVLHAAGGLEDGVIQAKTQESAERVFTTKLHGTLLLARLLEAERLDFMVLFSSTSALLGPPGQVDYVGANAFLNAFAEHRTRTGHFTLALGWGVWNEVGEASTLSRRLRGQPVEEATCRLTEHSLLGDCVEDGPARWRWEAVWRAADAWVLDEHRSGERLAILPGTGVLELARAAFRDALGPGPLRVRDVAFLAPLTVSDAETRRIEATLAAEGDAWCFELRSGDPPGELHARAMLAPLRGSAPPDVDLSALTARCTREAREAEPGATLLSSQEEQLGFGPRWATLRRVAFGDGEAIATLALEPRFVEDLREHPLHPALLDIATGFALPLIEGWAPGRALYVPLAHAELRVYAPLAPRLVSHVRCRPGSSAGAEVVTFDVTIADEAGDVLVEVEGYQMRRLDPAAPFGATASPMRRGHGGAHRPAPSPAEQVFLETYEAGIRVDEGVQALEQALATPTGGALLVSSIEIEAWRERLETACTREIETPAVQFERPELESTYEAPRDEIERTLVGFWQELLGVDRIGVHDDFFELGGHSLIAVRLFARIKRQWGIEWPISMLFDAPTVARCAERLREEGVASGAEGAQTPVASRAPSRRFLVPMNQVQETRKLPFFMVAGMFGNVLNLRHLAAHLGHDQPVYALQAKGLYGEDEPHRRFEEMAEEYLRELRSVQPEGPYLIGGFSGGGVTAFEMAQQLLAAGEEVGALIMLDAIPPHPAWPLPTRRDRLVIQWQRLRRQGLRYVALWARNRVRWEIEKAARRRRPPRQDLTPAEFRSEQIEAAFREALAHYRMRPYPGKIQLFRPPLDTAHDLGSGRMASSERVLIDHHNWWQPWATGGVEVQVVPGNHDSMVLEPSVRVLASRVRAALEDAQRWKPDASDR